MSYDFAFGHPIVYDDPKVQELEKTIEKLREQLEHISERYEEHIKMLPWWRNRVELLQNRLKTTDAIFDDYIAEKKIMKAKIDELQAENEKLKALLSAKA
jgi:chromosome segregation ATPase